MEGCHCLYITDGEWNLWTLLLRQEAPLLDCRGW